MSCPVGSSVPAPASAAPRRRVSSSAGGNGDDADDEFSPILLAFDKEADEALDLLAKTYGGGDGGGGADCAAAGSADELTKSDVVTLMDGWNKVLAFETAWKEACWLRWRILEAREAVRGGVRASVTIAAEAANKLGGGSKRSGREEKKESEGEGEAYLVPVKGGDDDDDEKTASAAGKDRRLSSYAARRTSILKQPAERLPKAELYREARRLVEVNEDPLASAVGSRTADGKNLMLALFDGSVRELCPHAQSVQREAYRPVADDGGAEAYGLELEAKSPGDVLRLLSRCGVRPAQALTLCEAFLFAMKTHVPYALDDETEDLSLPNDAGAFSRFVASRVARPLIDSMRSLRRSFAGSSLYTHHLPTFWADVKTRMSGSFGQRFYSNLLTTYPELLDYFNRTDMDQQSEHIVLAVDLIVQYPRSAGEAGGAFRKFTDHLGEMHTKLGIPTSAYPKVGRNLLKTLEPYAEGYVHYANWSDGHWGSTTMTEGQKGGGGGRTGDFDSGDSGGGGELTKEALMDGMLELYVATMSFTFYPTLRHERTVASAAEFFVQLSDELSWSPAQLSRRLLEVNLEITSSGTYNHTSEEIQVGMRLAWRNAVKCIGRISWNSLEVRDMRHVTEPGQIVQELERHLEMATAGTNIQSVMTVFRPRGPDEAFGMRLWTEQLVRYACYKDEETGQLFGDPANLEFTSFLLAKGLWTPPTPRTRQDCLPLVFSIPGQDKPYVHQFAPKFIDEAPIHHPDYPGVAELGYKWGAVPIINTFNIDLGGVEYGTFPFNGWFMSTEIVRNLMERFSWNTDLTKVMGLDPDTRMLELRVSHETEVAVLHSFDKAGYTIVDPKAAAEQYLVHCKREKDVGRECPAQWSWIGGLVGHTNPVWHKEMRDFRKTPQYEYTAHQWLVAGYADSTVEEEGEDEDPAELARSRDSELVLADALKGDGSTSQPTLAVPNVLIAYGSETGTAEAAAARLGRSLRLIRPTVASLNDVAGMDRDEWAPYTHVLVLCSTFGKGLPPTNAEAFFNDYELPEGCLGHVKASVLALGSTIYPDFCLAGIDAEKRLVKAGATMLAPIAKADAACDSAGTVTEWVNLVARLVLPPQLRGEIEARMGGANEPLRHRIKWVEDEDGGDGDGKDTDAASSSVIVEPFAWPDSVSVPCHLNEELLAEGDVDKRSTRRLRFDVPPGQSYVSGDHLSVKPLNSPESVERFARCFLDELGGDADDDDEAALKRSLRRPFRVVCEDNGRVYPAQLPFSCPASLSDVLQAEVSLSITDAWAAALVALIGEYVPSSAGGRPESSEAEADTEASRHPFAKMFNDLGGKILTGGKGKNAEAALNAFLGRYPTAMDLLEDFAAYRRETISSSDGGDSNSAAGATSTTMLPLAEFLAILPRLQPRLYSISSSNQVDPAAVEITVGVLHNHTHEGVHVRGVCSNYLGRLKPGGVDRVNATVRESSFRAPDDPTSPVIMVGAGTGLAPMIGFMTDRARALEEGGGTAEKKAKDIKRNCHLFFGARNEGEQIYGDTVARLEKSGVLRLHLALSRSEVVPKTYVQDEIAAFAETLSTILLDDSCSYYVCGDANMADRAYEACLDALKTRMSRVRAVRHLRLMRASGRWQSDLWGVSETLEEDYNETRRILSERKRNSALKWLSKVKRREDEREEDSTY